MPVEVRRNVNTAPAGASRDHVTPACALTSPDLNPRGNVILINRHFGHYKGLDKRLREADGSFVACSQLYEEEAQRLGCKPNKFLLDQLPKTPGSFVVKHINCGCNYISNKGVLAILPLVEVVLPSLRRLKLNDNGLRPEEVLQLLPILRESKALLSLDLSGNKALSVEVGAKCLTIAKENTCLLHLSLAKTSVSKQLQNNLDRQLKQNRRKHADKNKELLARHERIDRTQLFDMKTIYDAADYNSDGIVSVNELDQMKNQKLKQALSAQRDIFRRIADNRKSDRSEVTFLEFLQVGFPKVSRDDILFCIDCCSEFDYPDVVSGPELNTEQVEEILAIFRAYDKDKSGSLTIKELAEGLRRSAMCFDAADHITQYDKNKDGMLSPSEFVALMSDYYLEPSRSL